MNKNLEFAQKDIEKICQRIASNIKMLNNLSSDEKIDMSAFTQVSDSIRNDLRLLGEIQYDLQRMKVKIEQYGFEFEAMIKPGKFTLFKRMSVMDKIRSFFY